MNFNFTEAEIRRHNRLREKLARFVQAGNPEIEDRETAVRRVREALALLAAIGYLKPDQAGRPDASGGDLCLLGGMEILAEFSPSLFLAIETSTRLFGRMVAAWGAGEKQAEILQAVENGRVLGAVALSEKAMNVDNEPVETAGVESGAQVVVTGRKQYVVNGPAADWIAVVGRMEDAHAVFLVKNDTPGMRAEPRLATLGYDGVQIGCLQFHDCRISKDQVMVPPTGGDALAQIRQWENQILSAACLGMMRSSFEAARAYAATHHSGGKPIVAYQEIAFKLAEMLTLYQTSQLLAYRAAWMVNEDPKQARELTWCAKVFCAESAEKVAGQALQILGGEGYQRGNPAERAYRCAKYAQIAGTSTEIARVKIGDAVLGYRPA